MSADALLDSLLLRWEELAESGRTASPAELCRDCPALQPALEERIRNLQALRWLDRVKHEQSAETPTGQTLSDDPRFGGLTPDAEPVPGYRLLRRLGSGGFGEVWEARGPGGVPLAMKFIPCDGRAARMEARALEVMREIRHPRLLSTMGVWHCDNRMIIGMELADGTLHDRLLEVQATGQAGIQREELLGYLEQVAEGIDYLNEDRQIQHRDLKPQNLLLVGGSVKVADFGLTKIVNRTQTGHTGCYTLSYAAPEFFQGQTSRHSDQYSLAITYCHLRGGRVPFDGDIATVMAGHLTRDPDLGMLPREEREVVARALSKRPNERWPSCQAFVQALSAPTQGRGLRVDTRITRRRMLLGVLVSGAGVLGVGLLGVHAYLVRETPTRDSSPPETPVAEALTPVGGGTVEPPAELSLVERLVLPPNHAQVRRLALSPNSKRLLTNGGGSALIWDLENRSVLHHLPDVAGPGAAWAPEPFEEYVLTGGDNRSVVLWDPRTGKELSRYEGCKSSVSSVAFTLDASRLLGSCCDFTVRMWERATARELCCCTGHTALVTSATFLPTGRRGLSSSWDGTVRLWNLETGQQMGLFEEHTMKVWMVACSHDGRQAISVGEDGLILLWDLRNSTLTRRFQFHGQPQPTKCVAFSPDDRFAVTGSSDGTVRIWEVATGRELRGSRGHSVAVETVQRHTQGRPFVYSGAESVGVWRVDE